MIGYTVRVAMPTAQEGEVRGKGVAHSVYRAWDGPHHWVQVMRMIQLVRLE